MSTKKYLRMVFMTDRMKQVAIRVDDPREDLDAEEVKDVMHLIIANDSIHSTSGNLFSIKEAMVISTETTELDLSL